MAEFTAAYEQTMTHEGLYSNDPRDLGGETWKGISRKNFPNWAGWPIIDTIRRSVKPADFLKALRLDDELEDAVRDFYKTEFWNKLFCSEITDQVVAAELFDTAINQGLGKAARYFQEGLNLLNNNQKHYNDIEIDGRMGLNTLKAYEAYCNTASMPGRSVQRNAATLLKVLNGLQFERYAEICREKPDQEVFFYGWVNRV